MHLKVAGHAWPKEQSATQCLPLVPTSAQAKPVLPHWASVVQELQVGAGPVPGVQSPTGTKTYLSRPTTLPITSGGGSPGGGEPGLGGGVGDIVTVALVALNSTIEDDS